MSQNVPNIPLFPSPRGGYDVQNEAQFREAVRQAFLQLGLQIGSGGTGATGPAGPAGATGATGATGADGKVMRTLDFWWDIWERGDTFGAVPTGGRYASGSLPGTSDVFFSGTAGMSSGSIAVLNKGRRVVTAGTSSSIANVFCTKGLPLIHDKAWVKGVVNAAQQVYGVEVEMCVSGLPTDPTGGPSDNLAGIRFSTNGTTGSIFSGLGPYFGLIAGHDGCWHFYGKTKQTSFNVLPDVADITLSSSISVLDIHKFRFLFKSATAIAYATFELFVDDATTPAVSLDWNVLSTPARMPGYDTTTPWWGWAIIGDLTSGGVNGGVQTLLASAHMFAGPDDPAVF